LLNEVEVVCTTAPPETYRTGMMNFGGGESGWLSRGVTGIGMTSKKTCFHHLDVNVSGLPSFPRLCIAMQSSCERAPTSPFCNRDAVAKTIQERHEIVIETDQSVFTLTADSRDGRLLIQQRKKNGRSEREICALSLANPRELADFFDGLRRVLSSTGIRLSEDEAPQQAPAALARPARGTQAKTDDREEIVARARGRNPKAFEPWTPTEEADVRRRYEAGERIEDIARTHNRSPKAIEMRLERMGLLPPG